MKAYGDGAKAHDDAIKRYCEKELGDLVFDYRIPLRFGESDCNCPQALAQKAKLRRVGLKLAEKYLRSIEPPAYMTGRGGERPGDAHAHWLKRWRRVRAMMGAA